jgi:8-oxo-dGTP pyrophosphatase MutT (NUDIX family)
MDVASSGLLRTRTFTDPRGNQLIYNHATPATWRLSACALAVRDARVLMVLGEGSGAWELPGGRAEVHEFLPEAAARECLEETGYRFTAESSAPIHVAEQFFGWHDASTHFHHSVVLVYAGRIDAEPDPAWTRDATEVRCVAWMDPTALSAANTHPQHWQALTTAGIVTG